ncbi:MAG: hypothetical protein HRU75_06400 [Planctomycetia bacterium]|nr:MAG: hypothetical protein HRU75_06400 [Planctomycetia bacterium]
MNLRVVIALGTVMGVSAAAWIGWAAQRRDAAAASQPARAPLGVLEYRGVAVQLQTGHAVIETFTPALREIAELGADTVLLCPAGFMEHARAQAIFIEARQTPTADELRRLIEAARQMQLRVIVMPLLLLSHPRGSEWRGMIEPPEWSEWWPDYRAFILHFADAAAAGGADAFMVGSELVSTERNRTEWLRVIEAVRARFPGRLGYSANWDHYRPVSFWDQLDFAGVTTYNTLADRDLPTVDELVERWRPIRQRLLEFSRDVNRPLLLTEVGWCSQTGAARAPWDYYRNQKVTPDGLEEQRRLYEAFVRAFPAQPGLGGVIWWEWTPGGGGPKDFGYSPRGKPAERVLREWFRDTSDRATSRPAGAAGGEGGGRASE